MDIYEQKFIQSYATSSCMNISLYLVICLIFSVIIVNESVCYKMLLPV